MHKLFMVYILCFTSRALGADPPSWARSTPAATGKYRYYVGRASQSQSEEEAYRQADENARQQAIRDNFGTLTKIETGSSDTLGESFSHTRMDEISELIHLTGFEMVSDYIEETSTGAEPLFSAWILFRYPVDAILKEQKRLTLLRDAQSDAFNVYGDSNCPPDKNATLEVTTAEPGAYVFVAGEMIGRSPLRITCQLATGEPLSLQIDHPNYRTFQTQVVLRRGQTTKVNTPLVPALVDVVFTTTPPNAKIWIDGKPLGEAPTKTIELHAGRKYQVVAENFETERIAQEIQIPKQDATYVKHIVLPFKAATMEILSVPTGATLMTDKGVIYTTPTGHIPCEAGAHVFSISKIDFVTRKFSMTCVGGKHTSRNIDLMVDEEALERQSQMDKLVKKHRFRFGIGSQGLPFSKDNIHENMKVGVGWELNGDLIKLKQLALTLRYGHIGHSIDDTGYKVTGRPNSSEDVFTGVSNNQWSGIIEYNASPYVGFYLEKGRSNSNITVTRYEFNSSGYGKSQDSAQTLEITQDFYGGGLNLSTSELNSDWGIYATFGTRKFTSTPLFEGASPWVFKVGVEFRGF